MFCCCWQSPKRTPVPPAFLDAETVSETGKLATALWLTYDALKQIDDMRMECADGTTYIVDTDMYLQLRMAANSPDTKDILRLRHDWFHQATAALNKSPSHNKFELRLDHYGIIATLPCWDPQEQHLVIRLTRRT